MLDENLLLERLQEDAPREEFGLAQTDTPVRQDRGRAASYSASDYAPEASSVAASSDAEVTLLAGDGCRLGRRWKCRAGPR
jgi:RNA polymerase sigma-54 factor